MNNTFTDKQVYSIWSFANAQLQILKRKKENSENQLESLCLSFAANCIVDIMDEIADLLESNDKK